MLKKYVTSTYAFTLFLSMPWALHADFFDEELMNIVGNILSPSAQVQGSDTASVASADPTTYHEKIIENRLDHVMNKFLEENQLKIDDLNKRIQQAYKNKSPDQPNLEAEYDLLRRLSNYRYLDIFPHAKDYISDFLPDFTLIRSNQEAQQAEQQRLRTDWNAGTQHPAEATKKFNELMSTLNDELENLQGQLINIYQNLRQRIDELLRGRGLPGTEALLGTAQNVDEDATTAIAPSSLNSMLLFGTNLALRAAKSLNRKAERLANGRPVFVNADQKPSGTDDSSSTVPENSLALPYYPENPFEELVRRILHQMGYSSIPQWIQKWLQPEPTSIVGEEIIPQQTSPALEKPQELNEETSENGDDDVSTTELLKKAEELLNEYLKNDDNGDTESVNSLTPVVPTTDLLPTSDTHEEKQDDVRNPTTSTGEVVPEKTTNSKKKKKKKKPLPDPFNVEENLVEDLVEID